jgi:hypothetical protein
MITFVSVGLIRCVAVVSAAEGTTAAIVCGACGASPRGRRD